MDALKTMGSLTPLAPPLPGSALLTKQPLRQQPAAPIEHPHANRATTRQPPSQAARRRAAPPPAPAVGRADCGYHGEEYDYDDDEEDDSVARWREYRDDELEGVSAGVPMSMDELPPEDEPLPPRRNGARATGSAPRRTAFMRVDGFGDDEDADEPLDAYDEEDEYDDVADDVAVGAPVAREGDAPSPTWEAALERAAAQHAAAALHETRGGAEAVHLAAEETAAALEARLAALDQRSAHGEIGEIGHAILPPPPVVPVGGTSSRRNANEPEGVRRRTAAAGGVNAPPAKAARGGGSRGSSSLGERLDALDSVERSMQAHLARMQTLRSEAANDVNPAPASKSPPTRP